MDLRDYLDILRARWRLITVTTLLGVIAAAVASMMAVPQYTATAKTFVSVDPGGDTTVGAALQGSLFAQDRVKSYVDIVTADGVMGTVIEDLGLPLSPKQLASKIDVNNNLDTVTLDISATDPDPELAQQIANATASALEAQVELLEQPAGGGDPLVSINTTEKASLPTSPSSPRTMINLALGFLVGLATGVGAAVLLETLDTRIKSIETLTKHFDQPLLGVIGYEAEAEKKPLLSDSPGQSNRAESFRQVRTNLQFVDIDHRPKSIVVTSAVAREGKSTTAINLAMTIAQTGQPVFVIEGDLRRPKIAEYLGIEGNAGLTDVLVGRATVDEVMQPWGPSGNLWVMAAGPLPPNPSELLGSQAMADLIRHLEKRATLIIDAPPLLPVTDGAVLTRLAGGALMVIATGKTRREQLRTAEQNIEAVGGKILGLVLNMAPPRGPDSHRYGYGYQYDYSAVGNRGKFDDHPPVIPAGLGGLPGVNGSSTPTVPVGPLRGDAGQADPGQGGAGQADPGQADPGQGDAGQAQGQGGAGQRGSNDEPPPRPAVRVEPSAPATEARDRGDEREKAPTRPPTTSTVTASRPTPTQTDTKSDAPVLKADTTADEKVIGGAPGVPLAAAISPYGHREPRVDLLPADTASGARFGLDDDTPLGDVVEVGEVPVGGPLVDGQPPRPAELTGWTPPNPRAALDPLTAPYEQLRSHEDPDTPEDPNQQP